VWAGSSYVRHHAGHRGKRMSPTHSYVRTCPAA
jgi:hypothetical protein